MAIELLILVREDATEEEVKDIARELCVMPAVLGIFRQVPHDVRVTHEAPEATQ